ncbi:hypothetical protein [Azospirillum doebereinerae]|uniref:Uncharacterized protein n=1 Tax=Azospirillum doebereinerae TaxID=92933 RepID=A0A3S0WYB8_9PROT|nr:hypothetical protein [Azospirillum doebereinerae]MCG5240700.1 hypothetical protein [Azospirillum doebereinerae]RUQ69274.1 hypothetical protein EJ913_16000 [Azospirillum doebereinerae]
MPHIERTDQGEQYVLPGTERRTAPGLPYAAEPNGQLTLHFYAPPGEEERRSRPVSAAPATEKARGKSGTASAAGLFGRRLAHFPHVFDPV